MAFLGGWYRLLGIKETENRYLFAVKIQLFVSKSQTTNDGINLNTNYLRASLRNFSFSFSPPRLFDSFSYFADSDYFVFIGY